MMLRFKAPLLVATAAGVVFIGTGWACARAQLDYIQQVHHQTLTRIANAVKSGIEGTCRGAAGQADFLAHLGSVRDALAERDAAALDATIKPVYRLLSVRGAEEATFIDRDLKVVADVRAKLKPGADLSAREVVVRANRYRETQAGIEATANGIGVRAVASIDSGTEHLGSFEWGVGLGRLLERVKANTGADLSVFVQESAIVREAPLAGSKSADPAPAEGGGLKTVVSTNADLVKEVVTKDILDSVQEDTYSTRRILGDDYDIIGIPLFDFAGRQIGVIAGVKSTTEFRKEIAAMNRVFLVGTGVGVLLLALFVFLTFEKLLRRPLAVFEESLERFAKTGDLDSPIAHLGRPDEFGTAAKNINKLREKLVNETKLSAEAETIVTTRRLRKSAADQTIDEKKDEPPKI